MSFYKSLEHLWTKIQQKNIVLVSGNVDEFIPVTTNSYKNLFNQKSTDTPIGFINIVKYLEQKARLNSNFNVFSNFSPNFGNNIITKESQNKQISIEHNELNNNDSYSKEDIFEDSTIGLEEYIDYIKERFVVDNELGKPYSNYFIIDFSDVLINKQSNLTMIKLAQLIENFISYKQVYANQYLNNSSKLIIICRNPSIINSLITNNIEFCSVNISKPNKDEREEFLDIYKNRFENIKVMHSVSDPEFQSAITITDGLSFREIYQLAKLKVEDNTEPTLTLSELYKLATFFKKESEWEKIDNNKIIEIKEILNKRVKGQEQAIDQVYQTIVRSYIGMNGILHSDDNNKPKGVLFFAGPTGTGKTELAKAISELVFGDEKRIIRFDMSEFNHEHSDQRLIGAPPGYVGYDAGGELTNKVKQNPFSILLFDEIEKAHGKILDKFLQILEDGRLTSAQGEIIDFSQTFIIFTSNIGASTINSQDDYASVQNHFLNAVKHHFKNELNRPEILNRIGEKNIIAFNFIKDQNIIYSIIDSKLKKLSNNIYKQKLIKINYENNFVNQLVENIIEKAKLEYGGRGLITELESQLIDPLSQFIFQQYQKWQTNFNNKEITIINLDYKLNEIAFTLIH